MGDLEMAGGHAVGVALFEQRERWARLIARGSSNSEACRMVGVDRRTGTRWRYGRVILDAAGGACALSAGDELAATLGAAFGALSHTG